MTNPPELKELEKRRYGAAYEDGLIDVFVGVSLIWIGGMWLLLPDYLSGAVALVALLISPVMGRRRRLVEARTGYVKFTEPRRQRERRIYTTAGFLFAGFMLLARPLGSLRADDIDWAVGPDTFITWLLALVAVVLGVLVGGKRMFAYATALTATGAIAVMVDVPFGWPLLISGAAITLTGGAMTRRFVKQHQRIEAP
ncbi:MAG: hypothetical protein GY788_29450 [bacterium]|nr:hypothetical protein [bacterium]